MHSAMQSNESQSLLQMTWSGAKRACEIAKLLILFLFNELQGKTTLRRDFAK